MATQTKARKRRSPARKDVLMRRMEHAIPREKWATILGTSGDARADRVFQMLMDPAYRNHSPGKTLPAGRTEAARIAGPIQEIPARPSRIDRVSTAPLDHRRSGRGGPQPASQLQEV